MTRDRQPHSLTRTTLSDERGTIAVASAALLAILIGFAAIAIDVSIFIDSDTRLQAATDDAALAAAREPARAAAIARASLDGNGFSGAVISSIQLGHYQDNSSLSANQRFQVGGSTNAVRVITTYPVPAIFSRPFLDDDEITLGATSTAYSENIASFTALPDIVDIDSPAISSLLTLAIGSATTILDAQLNALANTKVGVPRLLQEIAEVQGSPSDTVEQVLNDTIGLHTLLAALSATISGSITGSPTSDQQTALTTLTQLAAHATDTDLVSVNDIVSLGVHDDRITADLPPIDEQGVRIRPVDAVMAFLHATSGEEQLKVNQTLSLAGLATVTVEIVMGRPSILGSPSRSPISATGPVGTTIYSSTARIRLVASVLNAINVPGISLHLSIPIIIDVGYGQATLSSINCGADTTTSTSVVINAQSGIARLYVGNVSNAAFNNLAAPISPTPSVIAQVSPLVTVTVDAQANLPASSNTALSYTYANMQNNTVKSVNSLLNVGDAVGTLISDLTIQVNGLALAAVRTLVGNLVRPVVTNVLNALIPNLEPLFDQLGLRMGYMDAAVTGVRCNVPVLVE